MVDFESENKYCLYDLKKLIELLCSPDGCPWDRAQTHMSIRRNMLEEAYEAAEAIDTGDMDHLCEELGDVLMQVVFHSEMAKKAGHFDLDDVADVTCRKLIRRHPHVFGEFKAKDGDQSLVFWDRVKREEKSQDTVAETLDGVARSLPALWRAEEIQKKAAAAGFDWPDISGALDALREELGELEEAAKSGVGVEEELGDLIFSAVNVARFLGVDPEKAAGASCDKFISRFRYLEDAAKAEGRVLEDMTLDEMDKLYNQAKTYFSFEKEK